MSNYYQTTLEQVAEWFMQLFFDPMYHVESVIGKNDLISHVQTNTSVSNLQETESTAMKDETTNYLASDAMRVVKQLLPKIMSYKLPDIGPSFHFNDNWLHPFKWQKYSVILH